MSEFIRQKGDQTHRHASTRNERSGREIANSLMGKASFMRKRKQRKPKQELTGLPYVGLSLEIKNNLSGTIDNASRILIDDTDRVRWLASEIARLVSRNFGPGIDPVSRKRAVESLKGKIIEAAIRGDNFKSHCEM